MQIWERLHAEHSRRICKIRDIEALKAGHQILEIDKIAEDTRKPHIRRKSPCKDILFKSRQRRELKRRELEEKSVPSFHPRILPLSSTLALMSGRSTASAFERLFPKQRLSPRDSKMEIIQANMSPSEVSTAISQFDSRQEAYKQAAAFRKKIRDAMDTHECSFVPTLSKGSINLAETCHGRGGIAELVHRLSFVDVQNRARKREELLRSENNRFSHIPTIDDRSNVLAHIHRISNESYSQRRSVEIGDNPSCITKTKTNKYRRIKPVYDMRQPSAILESIDRSRQAKADKAELIRRQRLDAEMNECTFRPQLHKRSYSRNHNPIYISGLDRFISMKQLGRSKDVRKRVTGLREYSPRRFSPPRLTLTSPFSLSISRPVSAASFN